MKINPFETIYFIWERWGGGCTMGCYQPMIACHDLKINARVMSRKEMKENFYKIKNSLVFIFKFKPNQKEVNSLKNNNNVVLRYVGDGLINNEINYHALVNNIDGIIVGSNKFKEEIKRNKNINSLIKTIPANHDYFLNETTFKKERQKNFKLFFGGSRDPSGIKSQGELGLEGHAYHEGYFHSLFYMYENMKGKSEVELKKYVINSKSCKHIESLKNSAFNPSRYACHYGVRSPVLYSPEGKKVLYRQWLTKTGGKVSTAAASGANIITSLDPSVRVLIDESYPYSIDTEKEDFIGNYREICSEMINKAKVTFGKKEWKEGLKIMNDVKEKTSTKVITKSYIDFGIKCYQAQG